MGPVHGVCATEIHRRTLVRSPQQHRELVSTRSADQLVLALGFAQASRDDGEQFIAGVIPKRVVDLAETVQIKK